MKRILSLVVILVIFFLVASFDAQKASALTLLNASASATTSRPSPSSPLSAVDPLIAGSSQVTVFNNTSTFLSSDSAKFFKSGSFSENLTVATTSASKLIVYFTAGTANIQGKQSVLAVPITAMHTVAFTTQTAIPIGGKIIISYPTSSAFAGADFNQASPSADTYMFNNLAQATDIQMRTSLGTATCSWAVTGATNGANNQTPTATCTTAAATIPAGATVWVFLGCTAATSTSAGGSCTTQKPLIINPTNTTARGTASVKNIALQTQDGASNILDNSTLKIGSIESVFVVAHVDPTFTFNIDGVAAAVDLNTVCSGLTGATYLTNSFPSTGTEVNLGTVGSGGVNYAAQKMTITSNTASGYAITATSSGFLLNPPTGQYIVNAQGVVAANNSPIPVVMPGTGGYGISACNSGGSVSTAVWGTTAPKFANPSAAFYYTLVNTSTALTAGTDTVYSVYGVRAQTTTPPGDYWQIITYNATVVF